MPLQKHTTPFDVIRTSAYLLICIFVMSCAQVVSPGGGSKDKIPPRVLHYMPDSAQLNFYSKSIQIDFDEYIQLKDLNNQLIISPPLINQPDISVKNKSLKIKFDKDETLKENTTYTFSFGNSIQDLNEGNPLENFKYIFSTGKYIDSLKIKGKVQNSFNLTTEKGILVILYNDPGDSVIFKNQPTYFSKTESDGTFQINNIKGGKYQLIAFKDVNVNYKYDGESENIGFIDSLIDISKKENILINQFQEPSKIVYFKKYIHDSYGKVSLIFNQGSDSLAEPLNNEVKKNQAFSELSANKDTLTYWINNFEKDSLVLQMRNGNKILDTISLTLIPREEAIKSKKNPLKLRVVSSPNGNQGFNLGSWLAIRFNHPIISDGTQTVILKEDTITSSAQFSDLKFHVENEIIYLSKREVQNTTVSPSDNFFTDWKENTNYHLLILPGTFTDIFGLTNDSIKIDFKTQEETYYGSIKLNLTVPTMGAAYIVQLMDESENVMRENFVKKSTQLNYEYLSPKKYKLKIIYDDNENKKWDTGNYFLKIQPEKVIYNSELINIRSNWDMELEWKITDKE